MRSTALAGLALVLAATAACADGPNLGRPIDPADIAPWDISIMPDGAGLPPGSGTVLKAQKFLQKDVRHATAIMARGLSSAPQSWADHHARVSTVQDHPYYWPYATRYSIYSPCDAVHAAQLPDK